MEYSKEQGLAKFCPELQNLPRGWVFAVDEERRMYFKKPHGDPPITTYNHPTLGGLPKPWILKLTTNTDGRAMSPMYYNTKTRVKTTQDPRFDKSVLEAQKKAAPKALWLMASSTRSTYKVDLETLVRAPIENKDIRDQFEIVHAIDRGDGSKGGMNGGIFAVRMKGITSKS